MHIGERERRVEHLPRKILEEADVGQPFRFLCSLYFGEPRAITHEEEDHVVAILEAPRGIEEAYGIMVNYLYDPERIEANHEMFVRGTVVHSASVDALLKAPASPAGKAPLVTTRRSRKTATLEPLPD